ncbi:MAG: anti-sigma F factor [Eubacteriales bacterium]
MQKINKTRAESCAGSRAVPSPARVIINQMKTEFRAVSENERLSRAMICAMASQLDITVDELADVRCAVSEAVTNAVVHAYRGEMCSARNTVYILTTLYSDRSIRIIVRDHGCGIADIRQAMEPLYTTDMTGERSGMGFAIMQNFMDTVKVKSTPGRGTTVELRKAFAPLPSGEAVTEEAAEKAAATCADADADADRTDAHDETGKKEDIA